jgi:4-carboxymuconolactone decarboxylase
MTDQKLSGIDIRKSVMGDEFVDKAMNDASAFRQPLQDFINEHAWGGVWTRPGLSLQTRSLITLAALTALKAPQELTGHVRGALNNGCTVTEIREVLLHCAVYAVFLRQQRLFEQHRLLSMLSAIFLLKV